MTTKSGDSKADLEPVRKESSTIEPDNAEPQQKQRKWGISVGFIPEISKPGTTDEDSQDRLDTTNAAWTTKLKVYRNLISFWLFGLTNNFGFVVMLSAAFDIWWVYDIYENVKDPSFKRPCNDISTGAILLANIIPSLIARAVAPFVPLWIHIRMAIVVSTSIMGLVIVALSNTTYIIIIGVGFISFASGLGETSLLAYTVFFKTKNVISTWASGTGAAGFFGALSYSSLLQIGLPPSKTILIMVIMPILMGVSFWIILDRPKVERYSMSTKDLYTKLSFRDKLSLMPTLLWHYTFPYGLVYFFEYFINQGLFELMQFPRTFLKTGQQYRWYNSIYQLGVFISRSSMNVLRIDCLWTLALLQFINVVVFLLEVIFGYMKYLPIPMVIILWEGLIGGWSYVNTYRLIAMERPENEKEFSMAFNAISDSVMIILAGIYAIPIHKVICKLKSPYNITIV